LNSTILVFLAYFMALIAITFYTSRQMNKVSVEEFADEFFVGGRKIGPLTLAILVAAGICSTGTFLGGPSLSGLYGPGYVMLMGMGQLPMNLYILGVLGKRINIVGRRTKADTYIDIFRYRFENYKPLIFILVVTILIFLIAAAVAEFTGGARVVQVMTGIPFIYSLLFFGGIIIFYTALGGLKGVGLVGLLQGFVMTLASILLIGGYLYHFKGIEPIFTAAKSIDPKLMTPTGGEASIIQLLGLWLTYGIGVLGLPWAVQSTLGYDSTKTMKKAIIIGVIFVAIWSIFITDLGGLAGRVFAPNLEIPDFNIPTLAQGVLYQPIAGLVLAGIAGAGQSTIAALFILASGSIMINAYKAFINPDLPAKKMKSISISVTAIVGIVTLILAVNPPPAMQFIITFSAGGCAAALIAPLLLGLYWPRANKYGAFAGVLSGLAGYLLFSQINLGIEVLKSSPLIFSFLLSIVLTIVVSLYSKKPSRETIEIYFGEM
jgi:sodium/pantothenate symporter